MYSEEFINIVSVLNQKNQDFVLIDKKQYNGHYSYFLLVKNNDYQKLFGDCHLQNITSINNERYWYGASKPKFWLLSNNDVIKVYKQIIVKSMTEGIWIPLDKAIQKSAFENKNAVSLSNNSTVFELCTLDKITYIISNAVFNTKEFSNDDIVYVNHNIKSIDVELLKFRLDKVFFKYTNILLDHLVNSRFEKILPDYLVFKDY